MDDVLRISQVAKELSVTPQYLRMLEWEGRIPPVRRDYNGRIYTECDITLLRRMGVGSRPHSLRRAEEILGAGE
jgi:DNA-binding transcriptional MerR regulator